MWLVAPADMHICGSIHISRGERILMEVSRKFTVPALRSMAFQAGWFWQVGCLPGVFCFVITLQ